MKKRLLGITLLIGMITGCDMVFNNYSSSSYGSITSNTSITSSFISESSYKDSSINNDSSSIENLKFYTLSGKIVDSSNNPFSDIQINLLKDDLLIANIIPNEKGEFCFENIEKGTYSLTFIVNDSNYEVIGTHNIFTIDGDNKEIVYPTIIVNKKDIIWGDLS